MFKLMPSCLVDGCMSDIKIEMVLYNAGVHKTEHRTKVQNEGSMYKASISVHVNTGWNMS
jgi:hypothetical protein